jgi:hypothetical protein
MSAVTVLVYQGALSLLAAFFLGSVPDCPDPSHCHNAYIVELTAVGGLIILGIGLKLLDLKESEDHVSWRALTELVEPDGKVVLEEEDAITIHAPQTPDAYLIDFDLLLRAKDKDVNFGKFFVGGLSVRMPWDKANPRQTHLNSEGQRNRDCEQKRATWCSVERPFGDDGIYGIAIFDAPTNPTHPPGWRADEQGLINPNVSALADWSIPAGKEQRFRYRLLVYRGSATPERLAAMFKKFADERRGDAPAK